MFDLLDFKIYINILAFRFSYKLKIQKNKNSMMIFKVKGQNLEIIYADMFYISLHWNSIASYSNRADFSARSGEKFKFVGNFSISSSQFYEQKSALSKYTVV